MGAPASRRLLLREPKGPARRRRSGSPLSDPGQSDDRAPPRFWPTHGFHGIFSNGDVASYLAPRRLPMTTDMDRAIPRSRWRSRRAWLGVGAVLGLGVIVYLAA